MAKKEILTNAEIEKDIINALKNPPNTPKASFQKMKIPCAIIAVLLVVIGFIYPISILWLLLALFIFMIVYAVFAHIKFRNQIKKVSISYYSVTKEVVHSTHEEHYIVRHGNKIRHFEQIDNYTIRFENGKSWRIPKDNYLWSVERPMSDFAIFQSTHREDTLIVVTKKNTDEIVMAYHTDFFEYKN
jgi:hypothetical protein